jgi:hypothetical protein
MLSQAKTSFHFLLNAVQGVKQSHYLREVVNSNRVLTLQGKPKHTTCRALRPHTYQPSPLIPRSQPGLTSLAYNAPLTPVAAVQ